MNKQWKWYVYIIECLDGTYYTGMTWKPEKGAIPLVPNREHFDFIKFYIQNKFLLISETLVILGAMGFIWRFIPQLI